MVDVSTRTLLLPLFHVLLIPPSPATVVGSDCLVLRSPSDSLTRALTSDELSQSRGLGASTITHQTFILQTFPLPFLPQHLGEREVRWLPLRTGGGGMPSTGQSYCSKESTAPDWFTQCMERLPQATAASSLEMIFQEESRSGIPVSRNIAKLWVTVNHTFINHISMIV